MDYVRLGSTGMKVSRICLGMMTYGDPNWREWVLDEDAGRPFVKRAVELGINFFDTADMYSIGVSEEVTGRLLREFTTRDQVIIATKVFHAIGDGPNDRGLSRKHIMDSIDASLKRLGTDYVDLYQIHRFDPETPVHETMEALNDVVRSGKARYIGASSMYAWQFAKMQGVAAMRGWSRFVSMQNHYNLIYREEEREMIPLCQDFGVGLIPWSPLARGFLTRKPNETTLRGKTDDIAHSMYGHPSDAAVIETVFTIAEKYGVKPAQIALAWMLHKPGITSPIIGASKMHHLEELIAALDVKLSDEDITTLEAPYQPHTILGHS